MCKEYIIPTSSLGECVSFRVLFNGTWILNNDLYRYICYSSQDNSKSKKRFIQLKFRSDKIITRNNVIRCISTSIDVIMF